MEKREVEVRNEPATGGWWMVRPFRYPLGTRSEEEALEAARTIEQMDRELDEMSDRGLLRVISEFQSRTAGWFRGRVHEHPGYDRYCWAKAKARGRGLR